MITSIELENVRLFDGKGWTFPISPVTVFCGTNSSGKSTLLKVLLLLKQSIALRDTSESLQGKLVFYSSQADIGNFHSIVTNHDRTRDIVLSVTIEDLVSVNLINYLRSLRNETANQSKERKAELDTYRLKSSFTFGLRKQSKTNFKNNPDESGIAGDLLYNNQSFLKTASFEMSYKDEELLSFQIISSIAHSGTENNTERYELILPRYFMDAFTKGMSIGLIGIETLDTKDSNESSAVRRYETTLRGILPQVLRAKWLEEGKSKESQRAKTKKAEPFSDLPLPPHLSFLIDDLRNALSRIHYLGPFRTPAKRYYIAHEDSSPDFDSTGEFLPFILQQRANAIIPGNFINKSGTPVQITLGKALNVWIHYLRTGERRDPSDVSDEILPLTSKEVLVELMLKTPTSDNSYALTDSGFGYSQVLPILVRGLLAEMGSTIIVEQPELHLNPALQVRLAEFFVEMSRLGKQVLLETHSEHLVNAIRILAAEDETNEIASKAGVIFMDTDFGRPTVKRLDILPDGTIPEWPTTFFGEAISLSARLLRAQKRFRTQKAQS